MTCLFLSLRPEFANKIISGVKTVEFRRTRPSVEEGRPVILYAATPLMCIVGVGYIEKVVSASPTRLWEMFGSDGGISRERFRRYFYGLSRGHAITLTDVEGLDRVVELSEIRNSLPGFQPPQAFMYLELSEVASLGLGVRTSFSELSR